MLGILIPLLFILSVVAAPTAPTYPKAHPAQVAELFKRAPSNDETPRYPSPYAIPTQIPRLWLDRLRNITLPACPVNRGGYGGQNAGGQAICSFPNGCWSATDLRDPIPGWIGINFDDGPSGGTDELHAYLLSQNATQRSTHFMIGSYILNSPGTFGKIARDGGHIAVHTWSHPRMTTISNEEIVAEIGWTMQIMADLNGGRIPKFWRPPYGDVDNRVRAIARGVFGLETVIWNEDTADWNIGGDSRYTVASVSQHFDEILRGSKSRGLNVLQHEVTSHSVQVFRNSFPKMAANGWRVGNIAEAFGMDWYQNSVGHGNTDPVASMEVAGLLAVPPSARSTITSTSTASVAVISTATSTATSAASSTATSAGPATSSSSIPTAAAVAPTVTSGSWRIAPPCSTLLALLFVIYGQL